MQTTVEQTLSDATRFFAFDRDRPPTAAIFEFGAWDRQLRSHAGLERDAVALLRDWARAAGRRGNATLIFAPPPRPWDGLEDGNKPLANCLGGAWARHVLKAAGPAPVAYLNRVLATDALRDSPAAVAACPCLANATYHPPHVANLVDVTRLANVLFPRRPPPGDAATLRVDLADCCCAAPPREIAGGALAYWARACLLPD